ncbi:MAG TPA: AAC(3) family N-acetyltransferase [Sinorhizobium sp.]|nr:AAC(3) family N-acetyltransferase [Sinorhizobium sp.]
MSIVGRDDTRRAGPSRVGTARTRSMLSRLASALPSSQKQKLKRIYLRTQAAYIKRYRSYDAAAFLDALRELGIRHGDSIFIHASFSALNGFQGTPLTLLSAFRAATGSEGTLLMPSSAYLGRTIDYLDGGEIFDARRTPSRMGILSEIFRRQRDTLRSLNPAHPVLASGPLASWFVAGHETCIHSCGAGSPYEKLVEKDAKVLLFDVGFSGLMIVHFLEHTVKDMLPYRLYADKVYETTVIDDQGRRRSVTVQPFSGETRTARVLALLEEGLRAKRLLRIGRVGNTLLQLIAARDAAELMTQLAVQGRLFFGTAER